MCPFEQELEVAIAAFTDNRKPFTTMEVRDKIRELFSMPVRYREVNFATLSYMQQNSRDLNYILKAIEVDTDKVDPLTGHNESVDVWQFTPSEQLNCAQVVNKAVSDSEDEDDRILPGLGFFSKLFKR